MKTQARIAWAAGAAAVVLCIHFAIAGAIGATAVHLLGYWAYLALFILNMGLVAGVLAVPWIRDRFALNPHRFEKRGWRWIRERGAFPLVLAAAVIIGPIYGAVVVRLLGMSGGRAWASALIATAVAVGFWVTVYLGGLSWLHSFIQRH